MTGTYSLSEFQYSIALFHMRYDT